MTAGLAGKLLASLIILGALSWAVGSLLADVVAWCLSRVRSPETARETLNVLARTAPIPEHPVVLGSDEEQVC